MKLSPSEKAAHRAAFQAMRPAEKLDHILTYYKWPILLGLIALVILGSTLYRQLTQKEPVLYLGFANVAAGSDLETGLTTDFLDASGGSSRRQELHLYRDLYLSEDADVLNHEYAYASRVKVMGAIQSQKLDLVLLNREAYDLFSRQGYLLDLDLWLEEQDAALLARLEPFLTENQVVLSDNYIEWTLNEAESHLVETETLRNGLEVTELPLFRSAGFGEPIYLGVIANSPRLDAAARYLNYLLEGAAERLP